MQILNLDPASIEKLSPVEATEIYHHIETVDDFVYFMRHCSVANRSHLAGNSSGYQVIGKAIGDWDAELNCDNDGKQLIGWLGENRSTVSKMSEEVKGSHEYYSEGHVRDVYDFGFGYNRLGLGPVLQKIVGQFGLENMECQVNMQMPNSIKAVHYDHLVTYYKKWSEQGHGKDKWNRETKSPRGRETVRLFVALEDFKYGWVVQLGDQQWTNFKKGDIISFDWQNTPHFTANGSYHPRPLLRVTGFMTEASRWIKSGARPVFYG